MSRPRRDSPGGMVFHVLNRGGRRLLLGGQRRHCYSRRKAKESRTNGNLPTAPIQPRAIAMSPEGRLSNRPEGNRLNHGVCFWSDDSDTPFLAVALAVLGLLELSLALGLGENRVRR